MYARTTRFQLQSGAQAEFMRIAHEVIAPGLQRQPGFRSITLLVDKRNDTVLGITQWASEANIDAINASGLNQRLLDALGHVLASAPVQEVFDVALQAEPL
jgi:heme-degrading monooxygenase HmoA